MSWWLDLAVLAVFVLLLVAMPWKRPHPNHVFALDMLGRLADSDLGAVSESDGVSGSGETVSSENDKCGDQA
jgi:hypothetical protein